MARCLLLGGTGFIGGHLAQVLTDAGHEVTTFGRRSSTRATTDRHIVGDFLDRTAVYDAVEGADFVFHLVSLTTPALSEANPFIDVETNVRMSVLLFEACVQRGVRRVIFASSGGSIYGDVLRDRHAETDVPQPVSPYAIGKSAIESYLRYFRVRHGLDSLSLRIANVYGEGQVSKAGQFGVVPTFLDRMVRGDEITVLGDGSMVRDYVYVGDLVRWMASIFDTPRPGHEIYNCGSGVGTSVLEVVRSLEEVSGLEARVTHRPVPSSFVHRSVLDCRLLREEFGLDGGIAFRAGVQRVWDDHRASRGA